MKNNIINAFQDEIEKNSDIIDPWHIGLLFGALGGMALAKKDIGPTVNKLAKTTIGAKKIVLPMAGAVVGGQVMKSFRRGKPARERLEGLFRDEVK